MFCQGVVFTTVSVLIFLYWIFEAWTVSLVGSVSALALAAVKTVSGTVQGVFYGLGKFRHHSNLVTLQSIIQVTCVFIALFYFKLNAGEIIFLMVLIAGVSLIWQFTILGVGYPQSALSIQWEVVFFGLKSHVNNVIAFLINRADLIIISAILSRADIGYFYLALSLVESMTLVTASLATLYFNKLATQKDSLKVIKLSRSMISASLFLSGVLLVSFMLFGEKIFTFLVGDAYSLTIEVLQITIFLLPIAAVTKSIATLFLSQELHHLNTHAAFIMLVSVLTLSPYLISKYGLVGAAFSIVIVNLLNLIIKCYQYSAFCKRRTC